jgi:hypothetical protein
VILDCLIEERRDEKLPVVPLPDEREMERREAVKVLRSPKWEEAEWLLKHLELYEQRIKELKTAIHDEAKTGENMQRL